jgi:hypothetical protein
MLLPSSRSRSRAGRFTAIELAIGFALLGSLLAVVVPAFVHAVHASRLAEPIDGLHRIGQAAIARAEGQPVARAFPSSAPLTPASPPRGRCAPDPPDAWEQPTWRALDFRPAAPGLPHCFAFQFDSTPGPQRSTFRATAHGDLDGDGILSTFEVVGQSVEGDSRGPVLEPGMFVDSEVE